MITAGPYPLEAEVIGVEQESPTIITPTLCLTDTEAANAYRFSPGQFNMLYVKVSARSPSPSPRSRRHRGLVAHGAWTGPYRTPVRMELVTASACAARSGAAGRWNSGRARPDHRAADSAAPRWPGDQLRQRAPPGLRSAGDPARRQTLRRLDLGRLLPSGPRRTTPRCCCRRIAVTIPGPIPPDR